MAIRFLHRLALAGCLALVLPAWAQDMARWTVIPSVALIGERADDPRFADAEEAIRFWNGIFESMGSGFRLGPATRHVQPVPQDALREFSALVLAGRVRPESTPGALHRLPGDISLVLGDTDFVSAVGPFVGPNKRVVLIRTATVPPLSLPNVSRNVIAHELGHTIGLGHNSDFSALMCGRPALCRPAQFQSEERRFFPLLPAEIEALRQLYPANWTPAAR